MARIIRRRTAQQIVETVRDVCNHNINFIDTKGIIFASTDASRVGNFHEIGRQVARTGEHIHRDYFAEFLESYHTDRKAEYRTVLVQLDSRYNPANLSFVEKDIYQTFAQTKSPFYTFQYPNEYILFLAESEWKRYQPVIQQLAEQYKDILRIGVGNSIRLTRQNQSYQAAKIALQSHVPHRYVMVFDELDLEILLGSVPSDVRVQFIKKTVEPLDEKEKQLLTTYFETSFSLKETCERLFVHKNTIQYQLDKIWRKCGYNPRVFRDAAVLYLGLQLE